MRRASGVPRPPTLDPLLRNIVPNKLSLSLALKGETSASPHPPPNCAASSTRASESFEAKVGDGRLGCRISVHVEGFRGQSRRWRPLRHWLWTHRRPWGCSGTAKFTKVSVLVFFVACFFFFAKFSEVSVLVFLDCKVPVYWLLITFTLPPAASASSFALPVEMNLFSVSRTTRFIEGTLRSCLAVAINSSLSATLSFCSSGVSCSPSSLTLLADILKSQCPSILAM